MALSESATSSKETTQVDEFRPSSAHHDAKPRSEALQAKDEGQTIGVRLNLVHTALCLTCFLVGLDLTIIATAIPRITERFKSLGDVGWYGSAFFIALCAAQPLAGKVYMSFPKKVVFLSYVAVFEVGSLVCATAPSSNALIVGRAIAGLGTSGIFGGSMIIIGTIVPLDRRAIYIGTLNSVYSIASVVGPVIGGALTQHVSWRWCFLINLPVGALAALMVLVLLRIEKAPTESVALIDKIKGLDGVGFFSFAGAVTMLLLALQWGGNLFAWKSAMIIGLFVGCGVVALVFIAWQLHMKDSALIPPSTFKNRNSTLIITSSLFVNGPFQTIVYWLPIWFQAVLAASPTSSGVRYLPTVISDFVTTLVASTIVMKLGIWNPFFLLGITLVSISGGLLTTLEPDISTGHWIGYQILGGSGFALVLSQSFLGLQASVRPEFVPVATTTLLTFMFISCTIALSIAQTVFSYRLVDNLGPIVGSDAARELLSQGATSIRSIVQNSDLSSAIRAYSESITQVFYIPAAAPVVSFILVLGCRWISTKPTAVGTLGEVADESEPSIA